MSYTIYTTPHFHGSQVVSEHETEAQALDALERYETGNDCQCGGCYVLIGPDGYSLDYHGDVDGRGLVLSGDAGYPAYVERCDYGIWTVEEAGAEAC